MKTRKLDVDVLLAPNTGDESVCDIVTLEEHISCTCGCKVTEGDCNHQIHNFVPRECKCLCSDTDAKMACHTQQFYWDETSCSCLCLPRNQWRTCHTGYVFNPSSEICACVSIYELALTILATLVVALVSSIGFIGASLLKCYRNKTGLFREDPEVSRRINASSSLNLSAMLINSTQSVVDL